MPTFRLTGAIAKPAATRMTPTPHFRTSKAQGLEPLGFRDATVFVLRGLPRPQKQLQIAASLAPGELEPVGKRENALFGGLDALGLGKQFELDECAELGDVIQRDLHLPALPRDFRLAALFADLGQRRKAERLQQIGKGFGTGRLAGQRQVDLARVLVVASSLGPL